MSLPSAVVLSALATFALACSGEDAPPLPPLAPAATIVDSQHARQVVRGRRDEVIVAQSDDHFVWAERLSLAGEQRWSTELATPFDGEGDDPARIEAAIAGLHMVAADDGGLWSMVPERDGFRVLRHDSGGGLRWETDVEASGSELLGLSVENEVFAHVFLRRADASVARLSFSASGELLTASENLPGFERAISFTVLPGGRLAAVVQDNREEKTVWVMEADLTFQFGVGASIDADMSIVVRVFDDHRFIMERRSSDYHDVLAYDLDPDANRPDSIASNPDAIVSLALGESLATIELDGERYAVGRGREAPVHLGTTAEMRVDSALGLENGQLVVVGEVGGVAGVFLYSLPAVPLD